LRGEKTISLEKNLTCPDAANCRALDDDGRARIPYPLVGCERQILAGRGDQFLGEKPDTLVKLPVFQHFSAFTDRES
jgi:hypothetical protein